MSVRPKECPIQFPDIQRMMAAASELRLKVVGLYRSLYRTRQELFHGDQVALTVSLQKLRHGFLENKNEADPEKIKNPIFNFLNKLLHNQLIKLGEEVNYLLKHKTVQCQLNNTGNYEMKIRKDTTLLDNAVYPNDKR
ncbi:uncharacterized protein TRIADDRAFT_55113 [Trichoplax adhaerens]|uniref:Complex III assembly factor LYRM7 n=1 Tax=Trichoplax adhaerens TaxID=10228 RepID=B3RU05_TRIAD|nr:hypothetical protein TRIADDRAFT_55113 [Trichoplax adhaerens]EDV25259.1 hypothetical protein TRIADDRAFT_55113 [Trichoplax adhaerens]|eukprot:XP_002111292.1 hypothetical protein TRIADDRAFT_55113 [Trichoplax adhaerens]